VRLQSIPQAYRAVLLQQHARLGAALRSALGWRLVVCNDGHPLPAPASTPASSNRFAVLADEGAAADSPPSALHGVFIAKAFPLPCGRRRLYYGVAARQPSASPPFVYRATYTDNDFETMTEAEVAGCRVDTVPASLRGCCCSCCPP
jgi:hypothetical protein